MKNIFKIITLFVLAFSLTACSDDDATTVVPTLDVNYANLHGSWELVEWNGSPLPDGVYCYLVLERREHSFRIYQKFDSMYARCITGVFELTVDADGCDIISGSYDYGMGDWNRDYVSTDLLEEGSMTWIVKGDESDVCVYCRCDEVPVEVIAESKSEE